MAYVLKYKDTDKYFKGVGLAGCSVEGVLVFDTIDEAKILQEAYKEEFGEDLEVVEVELVTK